MSGGVLELQAGCGTFMVFEDILMPLPSIVFPGGSSQPPRSARRARPQAGTSTPRGSRRCVRRVQGDE